MNPFKDNHRKQPVDESRFIRIWMKGLDDMTAHTSFLAAPIVLFAYAGATVLVGNEMTRAFVPLYVFFGVLTFGLAALKPSVTVKITVSVGTLILIMAVASWNMRQFGHVNDAVFFYRQSVTFIFSMILMAIVVGHRPLAMAALFLGVIGMFSAFCHDVDAWRSNIIVYVAIGVPTQVILHISGVYQRKVALRELTIRKKMAPAHVVSSSGIDPASLEHVFDARPRTGVCISSDWRGYQALSDTVSMEKLSRSLSEYYDVSEKILRESFPEGNFYFDWIADELFIVIFETPAMPIDKVATIALTTCVKIMKAKHTFYKAYGFPRSIDIGVSLGEAFVGMMGPQSFRKATALGRVPGRARRMQSLGKHLRDELGDYDRLIFGEEVLACVGAQVVAASLELDTARHAKDLTEKRIHYLLPRYAESASPETAYFEPKDAA